MCASFSLDEVKLSIFYSARWKEREMGISRKWAKAEGDEPVVFRCLMRLQINQADRSDQLGPESEAEKLKYKTLTRKQGWEVAKKKKSLK